MFFLIETLIIISILKQLFAPCLMSCKLNYCKIMLNSVLKLFFVFFITKKIVV